MIINSFGYMGGFQHFFIFLMKNGYCRSSGKKYAKMVLFVLKTHFEKIFLGYLYPPTLPMQKIGSKWSLNRFLQGGGGLLKPPHVKTFLGTILTQFFAQEGLGDKNNLGIFFKMGFELKSTIFSYFLPELRQQPFFIRNMKKC